MKQQLSSRRKPPFSGPWHVPPSLKDTLGILSVGSVVLSADGTILEINDRACADLHTDTNCLGMKYSELFTVQFGKKDLIPEIFERLGRHEGPQDVPDWTCVRRRGCDLKFFVTGRFFGQYDPRRKLNRVLFLFRNTEEEITRQFVLDMALGQMNIFPWFYDTENDKMVIDPRWFTHLGMREARHTIPSGEFFGLVHDEDRKMLLDALMGQLTGTLDDKWYSYRLRRTDGRWEWFETKSVYLGQSDDGSPYRLVGICQSIQDHKDIEQNLIEARDKARESDRLKSMFLANMSHEIRTPLNAILGFANLLTSEEYPSSEEEKKEYSHLITSNGEQLLRLISDILDLSKIESNTMEFEFRECSLQALLTGIWQAQRLNMRPGVELLAELPDTDLRITTDPARLEQVIHNLINNAVKFTDKGRIAVGCRLCGDAAELYVEDTGKGIEAEHLDRIFDRFYKADSFVKGVGLGLSICRTIVENLGGDITAASQPGVGTRFTLRLPLRPPRPPRPAP